MSLFGAVELQKYNSYCSDFNSCIISMHELNWRNNKCTIICSFTEDRLPQLTPMLSLKIKTISVQKTKSNQKKVFASILEVTNNNSGKRNI